MTQVSISQIEKMLNKYGKTLKQGEKNQHMALDIALDYMNEMLERTIKPYMEEPLVSLLGDVISNK